MDLNERQTEILCAVLAVLFIALLAAAFLTGVQT